jgi:GNAT superfamily N-acetyltransferase
VLTIREFDYQPLDYEQLSWLENALFDTQINTEDLVTRDHHRDSSLGFVRLIALDGGGAMVGVIEATQRPAPWFSRGEVRLAVRQDMRRRGIGGALLGALEGLLREHGGETAMLYTSETDAGINQFLLHHGYFESFRGYQQWLSLSGFDPNRFDPNWQPLLEQGIHLRSLAQLRDGWDTAKKFYDLYTTLERDAPRADEHFIAQSFEEFSANQYDSPSSFPEGVTFAVKDDELIGLNILYRDSQSSVFHNGLTGVRREFRGLGLALALKLEGIRVALAHGSEGITSYNASSNTAILRLNQKLGFMRSPATLEWRKNL